MQYSGKPAPRLSLCRFHDNGVPSTVTWLHVLAAAFPTLPCGRHSTHVAPLSDWAFDPVIAMLLYATCSCTKQQYYSTFSPCVLGPLHVNHYLLFACRSYKEVKQRFQLLFGTAVPAQVGHRSRDGVVLLLGCICGGQGWA